MALMDMEAFGVSELDRLFSKKLKRLKMGGAPTVLELCAGCGGLALGLRSAGFRLAAHVEANVDANATYALNFAPKDRGSMEVWSQPRDMISQSIQDLASDFGLTADHREAFDVLAAGLPCQAFARIGRSKLRSVSGDDDAYINDPRASLYKRFLEIVDETRPLVILLENVPDIMNFGGHNVPEEIAESLQTRGYVARYTLLNAAFYGVPQLRERLFLVAFDSKLNTSPPFPKPSHFLELPSGYESIRVMALRQVPNRDHHFEAIPQPAGTLTPAIWTEAALADLPFISAHLSDTSVLRRRKLSERLPYREDIAPTEYANTMRSWTGFDTNCDVSGNVIRLTARDFPIFGLMPHGVEYPVALGIAKQLLAEKIKREPDPPAPGSIRYRTIEKATVPPYDAGKFPNKWWKLDPLLPARTLTAHLGKDTYSHIHYDDRQKRMISVREAARLQSFPDGFEFVGGINASFRQIGNAVPPMLALAIGEALMDALSQADGGVISNIRRVA
jgi:DNA (cytosine-5)-methyltransferase 1